MSYSKLLRWYPRSWREENGDVFLGMLEDDAAARGATKPGFTEAWSIRVHGLAERASYKVALVLALLAVMGFGTPTLLDLPQYLLQAPVSLLSGTSYILVGFLGTLLGSVSLALAGVTMLLTSGAIDAGAAAAASLAFAASSLGMAVDSSAWGWGGLMGGHEIVDPPWPLTFSAEAAVLFGFIGSLAVSASLLRGLRSRTLGALASLALAVCATAALFGTPVAMRGPQIMVALILLAAAGLLIARQRGLDSNTSRQSQPPQGSTPSREVRKLRLLALAGSVGGVIAVSAFGAGNLVAPLLGLPIDNIQSGVLTGVAAAAPIPSVLAAGALRRSRLGPFALWSSALWAASLLMVAGGCALAPFVPSAYFLMMLGALPASLATTLAIAVFLPLPAGIRVPTAVMIGLLLAPLVATSCASIVLVAPFVCLAAGAWASWRLRQLPRQAETPPRSAPGALPA